METIVGSPLSSLFRSRYSGPSLMGSMSPSYVSVAESTAEASVFHMSVFNALYLLAIALAMAGWGWLIFDFVRWAIGG